MPQPEVEVKYDLDRVVQRFALALLPCVGYILTFHGFSRAIVPPPCSGGWLEALEFLAAFLVTAVAIETLQWAVWSLWKRRTHPAVVIGQVDSDSVVFSGGGLLFLPRKSLWSVVFAFVFFGMFLWSGTPNPCDGVIFTGRGLVGCFSFAYAALGFGSFVEFYDRGQPGGKTAS